MTESMTRRRILRAFGLAALATPLLQACGGAASPTTAPKAPEPAKPTAAPAAGTETKPTAAAAAKPTTAAAAQPTAQVVAGEKASLSIATYSGPSNEWQ